MNERDRLHVQAYVRDVAEQLELNDWRITIVDEPPEPGADGGESLAQIEDVYGRRLAALRLCPDFIALEPRVQRGTIVHELVHLHFQGAWDYAHLGVKQLLGAAFEPYRAAMCQHLEYGIDAVALAFAEKVPLPSFGPSPKRPTLGRPSDEKERPMATAKQKAAARRNLKKARAKRSKSKASRKRK